MIAHLTARSGRTLTFSDGSTIEIPSWASVSEGQLGEFDDWLLHFNFIVPPCEANEWHARDVKTRGFKLHPSARKADVERAIDLLTLHRAAMNIRLGTDPQPQESA